jgi:hypothetical protein
LAISSIWTCLLRNRSEISTAPSTLKVGSTTNSPVNVSQIIGRRIAYRVDDAADGPVGRGGDETACIKRTLDRGAIHGRQPGKDLLLLGVETDE